MSREEELEDLRAARRTRMDHMFNILADSYAGSPKALEVAQKNFRDGLRFTRDAATFAEHEINNLFKED